MSNNGQQAAQWARCGRHVDLVLEKRDSGSEMTGANEGSMSQEIRVRDAGGHILLLKEVTIRWKHFGQINAAFSDDGLSVVVTTTGGRDRVWKLP